jgi:hypothetical protein
MAVSYYCIQVTGAGLKTGQSVVAVLSCMHSVCTRPSEASLVLSPDEVPDKTDPELSVSGRMGQHILWVYPEQLEHHQANDGNQLRIDQSCIE